MLKKIFLMLLACSAFLPFAGDKLSASAQDINVQSDDVAWWGHRGWGGWYGGWGWNRWGGGYPYHNWGWYRPYPYYWNYNNPWYYT